MSQEIEQCWYKVGEIDPLKDKLILVFSPIYKVGNPMRLRFINSQFLNITKEVEYWCYVKEPVIKESINNI